VTASQDVVRNDLFSLGRHEALEAHGRRVLHHAIRQLADLPGIRARDSVDGFPAADGAFHGLNLAGCSDPMEGRYSALVGDHGVGGAVHDEDRDRSAGGQAVRVLGCRLLSDDGRDRIEYLRVIGSEAEAHVATVRDTG
jgi:hypothetical protein